ncbi:MAG TPA: hypothetical protein VFU90_15740, partial [Candidatus Tumulicola sp.]|nr:hypothetical protein [Candidatus Tumulicola sp.]
MGGGVEQWALSFASTMHWFGEQLDVSHTWHDAAVASAQSTSTTPQPQLHVPSPYVEAMHVQSAGMAHFALSFDAIEEGHGPFAHDPAAMHCWQFATP